MDVFLEEIQYNPRNITRNIFASTEKVLLIIVLVLFPPHELRVLDFSREVFLRYY